MSHNTVCSFVLSAHVVDSCMYNYTLIIVVNMPASSLPVLPSSHKYYEQITCAHTTSQLYIAMGG